MIVLDASAVVEMLLESPPGAAIAEELLGSEHALHAPYLLDAEVANSLRKSWFRGLISGARAGEALVDLSDLPIERHGHLILLERVWELRETLTAYDALYVALAESLGAPLMTCDARLARAPDLEIEVWLR